MDRETFPKILLKRRKELGLTTRKLAKIMGVSYASISHIEGRRRFPKKELYEKYCQVLSLHPETLEVLDDSYEFWKGRLLDFYNEVWRELAKGPEDGQ